MTQSENTLAAQSAALGPWFHNLHLPEGTQTAPDHFLGDFPRTKWHVLAPCIPDDLRGATVLDIGCNAGFYSLELARRGAIVTAIDSNPHYLRQAEWAANVFGLASQITFRQMQVYDLARTNETFDWVWFMGVFYHLRYPMLGLDIVTQKVKQRLVFQTLTLPGLEISDVPANLDIYDRNAMTADGWPRMAFIEHSLAGDPTNWWAANHAGVLALLRSCGLRVLATPGHEIYIAEPNPDAPSAMTTWNAAEYQAATGRTPDHD